MHFASDHPHVVIAGGGVAAVECALALHDLAGDRLRLTIVAPNREFELRPLSTAEPFSRDHVRRHSLAALAARVGAELVAAPVTRVHPDQHRVIAGDRTIAYDALVLAVGGQHRPAYQKAITFTGDAKGMDYNGLLQDIDEGYTHAVSFVVPPGVTWPLPIYELAIMTAREAWSMGIDDIKMQIVSPEAAPLALFGPQAADAMSALLEQARISFHGNAYVRETEAHRLELVPGGEELHSQRVVALPTIEGTPIDGVPADDHGFVPVDEQLRVVGLTDAFAAGDGTTFPVKQGGVACQQADAIAEQIAAAAGAPVEAEPFRPVLRGRVLAGHGAQYVEHALHGGAGDGPPSELRLWSVSRKIDGRYLSPWLQELEDAPAETPPEERVAGNVDIDLKLDDRALSLDPYLPVAHR
jgi:sulfide:quinone oxidoreductase